MMDLLLGVVAYLMAGALVSLIGLRRGVVSIALWAFVGSCVFWPLTLLLFAGEVFDGLDTARPFRAYYDKHRRAE